MNTRTLSSWVASVCGSICLSLAVQADPIPVNTGTAAQSTQLGGFVASNALDEVANFTHTLSTDPTPTWQVLLPDSYNFGLVTLWNRDAADGTLGCCPSRLRDITVQIVDFSGDVTSDFTGGTVVFESELLNPENVIGGGVASGGAVNLIVDAGGARGNMIRVLRTPDPDLSGSGGAGNADESGVLSLDKVEAEEGLPREGFRIFSISTDSLVSLSEVTFTFGPTTVSGLYAIESSDDLNVWIELDDGVPGEIDVTPFTDMFIPKGTTRRFYRAKLAE